MASSPDAPAKHATARPEGIDLTELEYYRVTSTSRLPSGVTVQFAATALQPSLRHLARSPHPLAVLWQRRSGRDPVDYIVGARPGGLALTASGDEHALCLPSAARGIRMAAPQIDGLAWVRLTGSLHPTQIVDTMAAVIDDGLERAIDQLANITFRWLTIATPVELREVRDLLQQFELRRPALESASSGSATAAHELAVLDARLSNCRNALAGGGAWRIESWVGAPTPAQAQGVGVALCGATHLRLYGVRLGVDPTDQPDPLELASDETLAAFFPPLQREVPGVRVERPRSFDVTLERGDASDSAIHLGSVLDALGRLSGSFSIPLRSLNRHTLVCGATGGGKSQSVRTMLTECSTLGIPWLVLEPAKSEYRRMAGRIASPVRVIRPGDASAPAYGLNPLEPAPGFPLQTHADLVRSLFVASFQAEEPFPQVLSQALTDCYRLSGWDLVTGESLPGWHDARYPSLSNLRHAALRVVDEIGYGREVASNVTGFIKVRLSSLSLGTPGRFLEGGHPIDVDQLLKHNVVIELEDIASDEEKSFLMGVVLIRLIEHLRIRHQGDSRLQHITVIEEAHRLLQAGTLGHTNKAVEMFASMLAEVRAYGEGLIVAEQIPSKLISDTVKNTAVKVMHRLPAGDDRATIGATMNLSDGQSAAVVALRPGEAACFFDGMDNPVLVQVHEAEHLERQGVASRTIAACGPPRAGCAVDCTREPCTLSVARAAELLAQRPWFTVWVAVSCASLLAGHADDDAEQQLDTAHCRTLQAEDRRVLECAIGLATDAAVTGRSWVALTYPPNLLTVALARRLLAAALGEPVAPIKAEEFSAGAFTFVAAQRRLLAEPDDTEVARRVAIETGVPLDGNSTAEWMASLTSAAVLRSGATRHTTLVGDDGEHMSLRDAVRRARGAYANAPMFISTVFRPLAAISVLEELSAQLQLLWEAP